MEFNFSVNSISVMARCLYFEKLLKFYLKGYCTVFKHTLKSLEITGIVLS